MVWQHILTWVFALVFFYSFTFGQVLTIAHYSWKERNDPQAYFKEDTLGAIRRLWHRHRVLWTIYFIILLLSITGLFAGVSRFLGAPYYLAWIIGLVGVTATEFGLYKGRGFLYRISFKKTRAKYWEEMELPHMFQIKTWPIFLIPILYLMLSLLQKIY
jgi:hypothetical protein